MPGKRTVYLDHAATTPLDPRVLEVMLPVLTSHFGNASSVHALGRKARQLVEESREEIAALVGAEPSEIVFTSGGTEADHAALLGLHHPEKPGLLTSLAEHEAVLRAAESLSESGQPVTWMKPDAAGAVTPAALAEALGDETGLVSLMHANNEVGTLTAVAEAAGFCRSKGVLFHTDAVQTAGWRVLDVEALGVDALSLSAHKFYGPKGIGVLYLRAGVPFSPHIRGGGQERGRRAGTEQVAGIVGMACALRLATEEGVDRSMAVLGLRNALAEGILAAFGDDVVVNTPLDGRSLPHLLNIAFLPKDGESIDGEMLLLNLDLEGICASSGSACTSGAIKPSHVLLALGLPPEVASTALRFSLGKQTTHEEINYTVEILTKVVERMRMFQRMLPATQ